MTHCLKTTDNTGRLARLALLLDQFNTDIKYAKGKENLCADALSRLISQQNREQLPKMLINQLNCSDGSEEKSNESDITIEQTFVKDLIRNYHDDPMLGHLGVKKTLKKLQQRYSFQNMKASVEDFVKNYDRCQRIKRKFDKPLHDQTIRSFAPWQDLCADVLGPLPETKEGNKFLWTVSVDGQKLSH